MRWRAGRVAAFRTVSGTIWTSVCPAEEAGALIGAPVERLLPPA
ncbi:hypothetical protein ACIRQP_11255 [Streptomyces sp. NPDC102274]